MGRFSECKLLAALAAAMSLTACVSHIPLEEQSPDVAYLDADRLVIAVIDKRWRLDEGKQDTELGVIRNMGIPSDMPVKKWFAGKDEQDKTLAGALEHRIVYGLNDEGWDTVAADFLQRPDAEQIAQLLAEQQATNLLLMTLTDWWVDINMNWVSDFKFDWGVVLEVFDTSGAIVGSYAEEGRDIVDEEASESWPNMIRRAYRARLITFLEQPEIVEALRIDTRPPVVAERDALTALSELKAAFDDGELTAEEYAAKRSELVDQAMVE